MKALTKTINANFGMGAVSGDVGIEIEVEFDGGDPESHPHVNGQHWKSKSDDSVPNGVEYVTKGPVTLADVRTRVNDLSTYIMTHDGKPKQGAYRASTHLHVNVTQDTLEDVIGQLIVFTAIEPLFLRLCGTARDGNLFCMSSYDTGDMTSFFVSMMKNIEKLEHYGWNGGRGKYSSLNIGRLSDLGTVEYRCFPSSLDGEQIEKWARWCLNIRDIAKVETNRTFRPILKDALANPEGFVQRVFGYVPYGAVYPNTVKELVEFGVENAYELTRVVKHYTSKKRSEKPEAEAKPMKRKAFFTQPESLPLGSVYDDFISATQPWPTPVTGVSGVEE